MIDPVEFGKAMADIVKEATAPLIKRIEELEAREPVKGEDGKSITPEDVAPMIAAEVAKAVAAIPAPKDGESVTVEDVAPLIGEQVKAAVDAIPKPKDGRDGKDAPPVEIAIEDITDAVLRAPEAIESAVSKHLEANPPAPGKDGVGMAGAAIDRDGNLIVTLTSGETKSLGRVVGADGQHGKDGADGRDGVGLAGASIDRDGALVVTLTNGEQKSLGPVVGRDGKDGADFSGVEIDYDGERTITIKGRGGEVTKRVPVPLDRGYWREGMACEKADILTHGGNAWIALRDTKAKPCLENKEDWRLFARKGRDGRDGRNGIDKTAPVELPKKGGDDQK